MNPWITLAIVAVTYVGIAIGRWPLLRCNRATIALVGVGALVVARQVPFDELPALLDYDTLLLLFSMMVINANLKLAGFFGVAGRGLLRWARSPRILLAVEIAAVGLLSALFLNDTVCLMFTPFVLELVRALGRRPMPYLLALATAANVGSTATLTGNPQNMIVGIASGLSYLDFAVALTPVAVLGLGVVWLVLVRLYPDEFRPGRLERAALEPAPFNRPLLIKSLAVVAGLLIAFLAGAPVAEAAFLAACVLLISRRVRPQTVFAEFDWSLLVFFAALFVVSGSLERNGVTARLFALAPLGEQVDVWNLSLITATLSNLVSNVPAVLLLKPVVAVLADPRAGWLTLAATSTLAGNLTLLGSVANLIVAEIALRHEVEITFWEYARAGVIITLLSLLLGVLWLQAVAWS